VFLALSIKYVILLRPSEVAIIKGLKEMELMVEAVSIRDREFKMRVKEKNKKMKTKEKTKRGR